MCNLKSTKRQRTPIFNFHRRGELLGAFKQEPDIWCLLLNLGTEYVVCLARDGDREWFSGWYTKSRIRATEIFLSKSAAAAAYVEAEF